MARGTYDSRGNVYSLCRVFKDVLEELENDEENDDSQPAEVGFRAILRAGLQEDPKVRPSSSSLTPNTHIYSGDNEFGFRSVRCSRPMSMRGIIIKTKPHVCREDLEEPIRYKANLSPNFKLKRRSSVWSTRGSTMGCYSLAEAERLLRLYGVIFFYLSNSQGDVDQGISITRDEEGGILFTIQIDWLTPYHVASDLINLSKILFHLPQDAQKRCESVKEPAARSKSEAMKTSLTSTSIPSHATESSTPSLTNLLT